MSFLTRTVPRVATYTSFAPRAFSTSFVVRKSATNTIKDTAKSVDRAVADKLVDGIEIGRMYTRPYSYAICASRCLRHLVMTLSTLSISVYYTSLTSREQFEVEE